MQPPNPIGDIFPLGWRSLAKEQDIRVSRLETRIQTAARESFSAKEHYSHNLSLQIFSHLAQLLSQQNPPLTAADPDPLLDQALRIHGRIINALQPNPSKPVLQADLERIQKELVEMTTFLHAHHEAFLARRLKNVSLVNRLDGYHPSVLSQQAPPIAKQKQTESLPVEWKKSFEKLNEQIDHLAEAKQHFEETEMKEAASLSRSFAGFNPLDPSNRTAGNYVAFKQTLLGKMAPEEAKLRALEQKVIKCLKEFLEPQFSSSSSHEVCKHLLNRLELAYHELDVNSSLFGSLICSQLQDPRYFSLLTHACIEDLEHTNIVTEVFRNTESMRGGIIGAYLTLLAEKMINPALRLWLDHTEQTSLSIDQVADKLIQLLELAKTQFCQTTYTPQEQELLNDVRQRIFKKWRCSGIDLLIKALFLRGATKTIINRALRSPHKAVLIKIGSQFQNEINTFKAPQLEAMEQHLHRQLKKI
ncbi:MAG: hypothetical protein LLG04_11000 [Parachlamydia sp.]|nr:hypothetical protein [Parachlamydia sp.]